MSVGVTRQQRTSQKFKLSKINYYEVSLKRTILRQLQTNSPRNETRQYTRLIRSENIPVDRRTYQSIIQKSSRRPDRDRSIKAQ